jgi:hypothetical protein
MRVVNYQRWPLTLEDGTILAADGTPGSTKEVTSLSDRDRRHVVAGRIAIVADNVTRHFVATIGDKTFAITQAADSVAVITPLDDEPPAVEAQPEALKPETQRPEVKPRPRGGRTHA